MWKYQDILERIFDGYEPEDDLYATRIKITDSRLVASQGPNYEEMTFEDGTFVLKGRFEDTRFERTSRCEYESEEEALFYWLGSFSYLLPKDSEVKGRVDDLKKLLFGIVKEGA